LDYSTRAENFPKHPHFAENPLLPLIQIQRIFFAYCEQARDACREGDWTVADVRQAADAALAQIPDFYFVRWHGPCSEEAKLEFRASFRQVIINEPQWKRHLSELIVLAGGAERGTKPSAPLEPAPEKPKPAVSRIPTKTANPPTPGAAPTTGQGGNVQPDMAPKPEGTRSSAGELLRYFRLQAGLSQDELASEAGIDKSLVQRIETGTVKRPQGKTLRDISQVLSKRLGRQVLPGELLTTERRQNAVETQSERH